MTSWPNVFIRLTTLSRRQGDFFWASIMATFYASSFTTRRNRIWPFSRTRSTC